MRRYCLALLIAGLALTASAAPITAIGLPVAANSLDSVPLVQKISPAQLGQLIDSCDHPLVVAFWATFCAPCLKELPYMQKSVAQYKDQGAELILVSLDNPIDFPSGIAAAAAGNGYTVRLFWLSDRSTGAGKAAVDPRYTASLPCVLFVNNRKHYHRFFDRQLTELQVEPELKKAL